MFTKSLGSQLALSHGPNCVLKRRLIICVKPENTLSGVLIERRIDKDSVYIWHIIFPLTSITFNLSLTYGRKIIRDPVYIGDPGIVEQVADKITCYTDCHPIFQEVDTNFLLEFLISFKRAKPKKAPHQDIDIALTTALSGQTSRARNLLNEQVDYLTWYTDECQRRSLRFRDGERLKNFELRLLQVESLKEFIAGKIDFKEYTRAASEANSHMLGLTC